MTGYKSKKDAALDEEGMYLVHQTAQPAQEPVAWKETDEVECPVCKDKGFPWPKCGHITYLEPTPPQPAQEPWCMKMNGCKTKCEDCPDEAALAQPAQEPVACIHKGHLYMAHEFMSGIPDNATLLYTTPPQENT